MNETTKHKRCPFCGRRDELIINGGSRYWVQCNHCGTTGPLADTPAEAWALWDAPRPKRKRKKAPALNTIRLTIEEYQRLALMASDLQQLKTEQPGGMPRNAITDLLTTCIDGARMLNDTDDVHASDLQDLLNQCVNANDNDYFGGDGRGEAGKRHYYAQIASVNEGVYR